MDHIVISFLYRGRGVTMYASLMLAKKSNVLLSLVGQVTYWVNVEISRDQEENMWMLCPEPAGD